MQEMPTTDTSTSMTTITAKAMRSLVAIFICSNFILSPWFFWRPPWIAP